MNAGEATAVEAPPRRRLVQLTAIGYLVALTVLLVHPDVFSLFGAGGKSVEHQVDVTVNGFLQHLGAYALLGALMYGGYVRSRGSFVFVFVFGLLVLHALLTECVQAIVPNRTADWSDLLANWSGIAIAGCWCWAASSRRRHATELSQRVEGDAGKAF